MTIKKSFLRIFFIILFAVILLTLAALFSIYRDSGLDYHYPATYFSNFGLSGTEKTLFNTSWGLSTELQVNPYIEGLNKDIFTYSVILLIIILLSVFIKNVWHIIKNRHELNFLRKIYYFFVPTLLLSVSFLLLVIFLSPVIFSILIYPSVYKIEKTLDNKGNYEGKIIRDFSEVEDLLNKGANLMVGKNVFISHLVTGGKTGSFYNSVYIPTVVDYVLENNLLNNTEGYLDNDFYFFLESNTLVVVNIKDSDKLLWLVNNTLSKKLPLYSNGEVHLKGDPEEFLILSEDDYTPFYLQKIDQNSKKVIDENERAIANNINLIAECRKIILDNRVILNNEESQYKAGCVDYNKISNCVEYRSEIDLLKADVQAEEINCEENIVLASRYITESEGFVKAEKELIDAVNRKEESLERNKAELSVGVFMNPSSVYIKKSEDAFELYGVALHEMLHYISSGPNRDLPNFLDEGLTDYYTGKALGFRDYINVSYSGYYFEEQIILALLEKIPESELLSIYILGEEKNFQKLFEKYFPDADYMQFISRGERGFNTTYEIGEERISLNGSLRSYINIPDIQDIRIGLGLDPLYVF